MGANAEEVLATVCHSLDLRVGDFVEARADSNKYPGQRFRADDLVIEIAQTGEAARRLRLEVAGREWAASQGVETPEIIAAADDGGWMASRWTSTVAPQGEAYVDAALAAAAAIAAAGDLPAATQEASSWSAPRSTRLLRGARVVLGGVPLRLWRATRAQLDAFEHPMAIAHGDFYPRNVLNTGTGVQVVDWEFVGRLPRHSDLARLWSVLDRPEDRDRVLAEMLAGADAEERRRVGTLVLWHSLRLLGENLSAPPRLRTPETLAHARSMIGPASALARDLGAWPL